MKLRKYTLEQLREAIKSSVSVRQVLQELGIREAGGNYYIFHKAVRHFGLDTSHFTGQNLRGRKLPQRRRPFAEWNNELSNLRLLCPNCHALTPTYRGRNITPKA